jgi:hypothetical protein
MTPDSENEPRIVVQNFETVDEATDIVEILTENGVKREAIQIE